MAKNNHTSCDTTSTFQIGPIVNYVFYIEGRDAIPNQKHFVLIHGDFDAQNILVEHSSVNNEIKIVGIIDWEFSRTGTLWNLCKYPIWIQEETQPYEDLNERKF
ncbi:aminoglycoside phosphotransferase family protein [Rhizophagus clarus]|uniref:Aminoglycoside phosphotransferase family protein n=1 Tax=Rhizophagus clarus TaxID=94130 RepID=A0A8H3QD82_9GLOM|nr:aminoglycoside phosphotransferase family protein [Rhizophagus clarus]